MVNALRHLHSKNAHHGDIRPQMVGINKKRGSYELLDRLNDTNSIEQNQINKIIGDKDIYMSP